MSELERSQEGAITAPEAILFVDGVKRFQPLLQSTLEDELPETRLGEGIVEDPIVSRMEAAEAAVFGIDGTQLSLEREARVFEVGDMKLHTTDWRVDIFDLIEGDDNAGDNQVLRRRRHEVRDHRKWSVLVPSFKMEYWLLDPETEETTPLIPESQQEIMREAEQIAESAIENGATRQKAILRAGFAAIELQEAKDEAVQELEAQMGIRDDSEVFTPERFTEVMQFLGRVTPEHQID